LFSVTVSQRNANISQVFTADSRYDARGIQCSSYAGPGWHKPRTGKTDDESYVGTYARHAAHAIGILVALMYGASADLRIALDAPHGCD